MKLVISYLYPTIMSHYGDRGNVMCLTQRCRWRGIQVEVQELALGEAVDPDAADILLMGGGADSHQRLIAQDLLSVKGDGLRRAVEEGAAALMICGAYQLWGHYYRPARGEDLPGLGIFDAYTVHRAAQTGARLDSITQAGQVRAVDNLVVQWGEGTLKGPQKVARLSGDLSVPLAHHGGSPGKSARFARGYLVGFENHGGRTYLNPGARPLGKVLVGGGNNSEDGWEGCLYKNAIGTYLHGSVLPKNPHLADYLIAAALRRRYGQVELEPLDDDWEMEAHRRAVQQALAARRGLGRLFQRMPWRKRD